MQTRSPPPPPPLFSLVFRKLRFREKDEDAASFVPIRILGIVSRNLRQPNVTMTRYTKRYTNRKDLFFIHLPFSSFLALRELIYLLSRKENFSKEFSLFLIQNFIFNRWKNSLDEKSKWEGGSKIESYVADQCTDSPPSRECHRRSGNVQSSCEI